MTPVSREEQEGRIREKARRRIDEIDQKIANLLARRRRHAIMAAGARSGSRDPGREEEVLRKVGRRLERENLRGTYDHGRIWEPIFAATRGPLPAWRVVADAVELKRCPSCGAVNFEGMESCAECGGGPYDDYCWRRASPLRSGPED